MKLKENRTVACAVLVIVILFTVFILGGNRLAGQRSAAEAIFSAGEESIAADLKDAADCAGVMISIADNAKDANRSYIDAANEALEALREGKTIGDKSAATVKLTQAVENLYTNASNLSLSEKDAGDLKYNYRNYSSAMDRISHDFAYNQAAEAFNKEKSGFPASLICALRGIKNCDIFG